MSGDEAMAWVKWRKGRANRNEADEAAGRGPAAQSARARKGGDSYAKEWVKVLEETGTERDPDGTYTWELSPGTRADPSGPPPEKPRDKATASPGDTYTWELQPGEPGDDPWGLSREQATDVRRRRDGVNPYDTGAFDATWTGRFDRR